MGPLRIVGARSRGKTVLVAQENARELADTSNTLRGAGYDVREALSLDQAMWLLSQHRPDLLVADIGLGHDNGLQLVWARHGTAPHQVPQRLSRIATMTQVARSRHAGSGARLFELARQASGPPAPRRITDRVRSTHGRRGTGDATHRTPWPSRRRHGRALWRAHRHERWRLSPSFFAGGRRASTPDPTASDSDREARPWRLARVEKNDLRRRSIRCGRLRRSTLVAGLAPFRHECRTEWSEP